MTSRSMARHAAGVQRVEAEGRAARLRGVQRVHRGEPTRGEREEPGNVSPSQRRAHEGMLLYAKIHRVDPKFAS